MLVKVISCIHWCVYKPIVKKAVCNAMKNNYKRNSTNPLPMRCDLLPVYMAQMFFRRELFRFYSENSTNKNVNLNNIINTLIKCGILFAFGI